MVGRNHFPFGSISFQETCSNLVVYTNIGSLGLGSFGLLFGQIIATSHDLTPKNVAEEGKSAYFR